MNEMSLTRRSDGRWTRLWVYNELSGSNVAACYSSKPILSFTAPRSLCLQPRYRSVVSTDRKSEQELDLLQLAAGGMAEPGASAATIMRRQSGDSSRSRVFLDHVPDYLLRDALTPDRTPYGQNIHAAHEYFDYTGMAAGWRRRPEMELIQTPYGAAMAEFAVR